MFDFPADYEESKAVGRIDEILKELSQANMWDQHHTRGQKERLSKLEDLASDMRAAKKTKDKQAASWFQSWQEEFEEEFLSLGPDDLPFPNPPPSFKPEDDQARLVFEAEAKSARKLLKNLEKANMWDQYHNQGRPIERERVLQDIQELLESTKDGLPPWFSNWLHTWKDTYLALGWGSLPPLEREEAEEEIESPVVPDDVDPDEAAPKRGGGGSAQSSRSPEEAAPKRGGGASPPHPPQPKAAPSSSRYEAHQATKVDDDSQGVTSSEVALVSRPPTQRAEVSRQPRTPEPSSAAAASRTEQAVGRSHLPELSSSAAATSYNAQASFFVPPAWNNLSQSAFSGNKAQVRVRRQQMLKDWTNRATVQNRHDVMVLTKDYKVGVCECSCKVEHNGQEVPGFKVKMQDGTVETFPADQLRPVRATEQALGEMVALFPDEGLQPVRAPEQIAAPNAVRGIIDEYKKKKMGFQDIHEQKLRTLSEYSDEVSRKVRAYNDRDFQKTIEEHKEGLCKLDSQLSAACSRDLGAEDIYRAVFEQDHPEGMDVEEMNEKSEEKKEELLWVRCDKSGRAGTAYMEAMDQHLGFSLVQKFLKSGDATSSYPELSEGVAILPGKARAVVYEAEERLESLEAQLHEAKKTDDSLRNQTTNKAKEIKKLWEQIAQAHDDYDKLGADWEVSKYNVGTINAAIAGVSSYLDESRKLTKQVEDDCDKLTAQIAKKKHEVEDRVKVVGREAIDKMTFLPQLAKKLGVVLELEHMRRTFLEDAEEKLKEEVRAVEREYQTELARLEQDKQGKLSTGTCNKLVSKKKKLQEKANRCSAEVKASQATTDRAEERLGQLDKVSLYSDKLEPDASKQEGEDEGRNYWSAWPAEYWKRDPKQDGAAPRDADLSGLKAQFGYAVGQLHEDLETVRSQSQQASSSAIVAADLEARLKAESEKKFENFKKQFAYDFKENMKDVLREEIRREFQEQQEQQQREQKQQQETQQ